MKGLNGVHYMVLREVDFGVDWIWKWAFGCLCGGFGLGIPVHCI